MGCYPLVPYSNRIGHACFEWDGTAQMLRPNFPGEPHAIHGFAWQRAWAVESATDTNVALTL
ncbi:aldose epimerase family protein, partial [Klebsiella pneumoniae]